MHIWRVAYELETQHKQSKAELDKLAGSHHAMQAQIQALEVRTGIVRVRANIDYVFNRVAQLQVSDVDWGSQIELLTSFEYVPLVQGCYTKHPPRQGVVSPIHS